MKTNRAHMVDILFTLALFCVFAASALMVVIIGADVYRSTVMDMTRNYNTRTSITYIAEKLRQNDVAGGVSVRQVEGKDALVLTQTLQNRSYETWIYTGGGELREVMVPAGAVVKATDGQAIMPIGELTLRREGGLLCMTATDPEGEVSRMTLGTRCQ